MNQKQKVFAFIIIIGIVVLVLTIAGGSGQLEFNNQTNNQSVIADETADWKIHIEERYGFSFKYPSSLKIDAQGPNVAQQELNEGKQISGTATPSYETIYFRDSTNKAKFQIDVFHTTDKNISIDNYKDYFYAFGTCDLRYLNDEPLVKVIQKNGISFIQADVVGVGNLPRSCFYLKNKNNNLIVLSMLASDSKLDYDSTMRIVENILSTFKFTPIYKTDFNGSDLYGRLYRSDDDGKTWQEILNQYKGEITYAVDPQNTNIIYAGDVAGNMMAQDPDIDLLKSVDAGKTWTDILNGISIQVNDKNWINGIGSIYIDENDSNIIYVALNDILPFKSLDGGHSWSKEITIHVGGFSKRSFNLDEKTFIAFGGKLSNIAYRINITDKTNLLKELTPLTTIKYLRSIKHLRISQRT